MRQVTVIKMEKVQKIASKLGLEVKEKKSEFKFFHKEAGVKRSIAVPCTKGGATRIYLVGYEMPAESGFIAHPKPPAKTVTQMLDHGADEKTCLRAIYAAAKALIPVAKPAEVTESTEQPAQEAQTEAA